MSLSKFLGSFVQATLFGGTYDDLSFELRVLKNELAALHKRLDAELDTLSDRLDKLEGKPGKGKGRSRLAIVGAAELADLPPEPKLDAAPGLQTVTSTPPAADPGFLADMTIRAAWTSHPAAPQVFAEHHLPGCIDCALSASESIAEGAGDHGLDVQALLDDLNRLGSA
jgi:hybrid cluster-associated redox disulfide protein